MNRNTLTQQRAMELLSYEPETGVLTWISHHGLTQYPGKVAGGMSGKYRLIYIDGQYHGAHRLAWLIMTGAFPPPKIDIDHIDRNPDNNAWANLRLASRSQNCANFAPRANSHSKWKGVDYRKSAGKWRARIRHDGKHLEIGEYRSEAEAAEAYIFAALELHGEYARVA